VTDTPASADAVEVERADEQFRAWMRGHLAHAAATFGVVVTGEPVFGWCLRSVSAPVRPRDGGSATRYWLRVGTERDEDLASPDVAAMWNGFAEANAVSGVAKPIVVASTDWPEPGWQRQVRPDAATLYLFSLLAARTSAQVRTVFADVLDSPDGQRAQVAVASRILMRAKHGYYPRLAMVVRRAIQPIVDAL
jgi:hypothetical protein